MFYYAGFDQYWADLELRAETENITQCLEIVMKEPIHPKSKNFR